MNREQDAGKEQARHISMELTADSARVVNLSLDGSRLVLTIEAELAGSQLRSIDGATQSQTTADKSDTEFVFNHTLKDPASGAAVAQAAVPDLLDDDVMRGTNSERFVPGGSEAVRPSPAPADPIFRPEAPAAPAPMPAPPVLQVTPPAPEAARVLHESEPLPPMDPHTLAGLPEVPPLEPVRELTDTWDAATSSRRTTRLVLSETQRDEPAIVGATPEPEPEYEITETWDTSKDGAAPERLAVDSVSHPTEAMPASILTGIEDTFQASPVQPAPVMTPEVEPTPEAAEPPAIAEESSTVGGDRHGEPQPGITFGAAPAPEPEPELPRPEAPVFEPQQPSAPPEEEQSATETPRYGDNVATQMAPSVGDLAPKPKAPEASGTTVLIRYTCPKCKTQGMQAVDKVGTVVNCSNCGKAMRLVMKK